MGLFGRVIKFWKRYLVWFLAAAIIPWLVTGVVHRVMGFTFGCCVGLIVTCAGWFLIVRFAGGWTS